MENHVLIIICFAEIEDFNNVKDCRNMTNFEDQTARSLLVVAPSPPNQTYEAFSKDVTAFSNKSPFNFKDSLLGAKFRKFVRSDRNLNENQKNLL